jgi:nucleotide-binding universal stress UspA family protein
VYARIIVPIDGAKRALDPLPHAEALAGAWGCPLEVVHVAVLDDPPPEAAPTGHGVRRIDHHEAAAALREDALSTDPPGLLCMASHGRTAAGELLFGTVTGRVIRTLHRPLVVTGPGLVAPSDPGEVRRLLVCLDGSTTSATILPVARTWASELGLEIVLLHVAYPVGNPTTGQGDVAEETRVIAAELKRTADDLADAGIDVRWHVVEDTAPATGIVRQTAHRGADLIVMATHGRTGLARVLAGSVATEVIRHAPVPVLTLRPEHLH